jgi:hypothetical protein
VDRGSPTCSPRCWAPTFLSWGDPTQCLGRDQSISTRLWPVAEDTAFESEVREQASSAGHLPRSGRFRRAIIASCIVKRSIFVSVFGDTMDIPCGLLPRIDDWRYRICDLPWRVKLSYSEGLQTRDHAQSFKVLGNIHSPLCIAVGTSVDWLNNELTCMEVRLGNAGTFGCVPHYQLKNPSDSFALQAEPFCTLVAVK